MPRPRHEQEALIEVGQPAGEGREWLGQLDVLRFLGCLSVIAIHCVGAPYGDQPVTVGWVTLMLHYSREVFLFTSALVLVRAYYPKVAGVRQPIAGSAFRWRRTWQIGLPYLCWTTGYLLLALVHERRTTSLPTALRDLPLRWTTLVVTGTGSYHLYFLLVSMQLGVVLPVVTWLVRRTEGRHGRLLVVSFVVQAVTLYGYQRWGLPSAGWRALIGDASLPAYQFWLLSGALAGVHLQEWHRVILRHRRFVLAALPVTAGVVSAVYFGQLRTLGVGGASAPMQPVVLVWACSALAASYVVAVWLAALRVSRLKRLFRLVGYLSFGVYLAHPLVLDLVMVVLRRFGLARPDAATVLVVLVLTCVLTVLFCLLVLRTPVSAALIGRKQPPRSIGRFPDVAAETMRASPGQRVVDTRRAAA